MKSYWQSLKECLPAYLLINVVVLFISLVLFWGLGGEVFSPYIKSMALNIMSVGDFTFYLLSLSAYGFVIEFILRRLLQSYFLKGGCAKKKVVAFILPIVVYMGVHSRFGYVGLIYGGAIGAFLSYFYMKKQNWLSFSLWHGTWAFIIVPLCMVLCVFQSGQIRSDFLFSYKKRHILKEKMHYLEDWGWVDSIHYRPDHYEHISKALLAGDSEVFIEDGWITPLKIPVTFRCDYQIVKGNSDLENWAIVTGIMLDFMHQNETVQELSPWFHGNQLSAWQFDDMSSSLLCCLHNLPSDKRISFGREIFKPESLMKIWAREGEELVGLKVKEEQCWNMVPGTRRHELQMLVKKMRSNWSQTSFSKSYE